MNFESQCEKCGRETDELTNGLCCFCRLSPSVDICEFPDSVVLDRAINILVKQLTALRIQWNTLNDEMRSLKAVIESLNNYNRREN